MPFKLCQGRESDARGTQIVVCAEVAKSCSTDDVTMEDEEIERDVAIQCREGVAGPTVIKHTHAHAHTLVCSITTTKTYSNLHASLYIHRDSHVYSFLSPFFSLALQTQWCIVQPDLVPVQRQREPRLLKQRAHY